LVVGPPVWQEIFFLTDLLGARALPNNSFHVVDERVLGYVLNTKTRQGCTGTVQTSTLSQLGAPT
jgi:hypothetical protein